MPFRSVTRLSTGLVGAVLLAAILYLILQRPEFTLRDNTGKLVFWSLLLLAGITSVAAVGTLVERAVQGVSAGGRAGTWILVSVCSLGLVRLLWPHHATSVLSLALAVVASLLAVFGTVAVWTVTFGMMQTSVTALSRRAALPGWFMIGAGLAWGMLWLIGRIIAL